MPVANHLGELPTSLWTGEVLRLPPLLAQSYLACLEAHNLLDCAEGPRPDPAPIGGYSQEQTDLHFAHAFDGSVARVELALIDPAHEVATTSATLIRFLSGGSLCLVDVPCGAGAASLSLICTICELRSAGILPRLPLNIHIIGGEISDPARAYANELLNSLKAAWSAEGVFVTQDLTHWDVLSSVSNGELVREDHFTEARITANTCRGKQLQRVSRDEQ